MAHKPSECYGTALPYFGVGVRGGVSILGRIEANECLGGGGVGKSQKAQMGRFFSGAEGKEAGARGFGSLS